MELTARHGVLQVVRTAREGEILAGTKTDHGEASPARLVPCPPGLLELLRAMPARSDTELLFPAPRGLLWRERKFYRDVWYPAQARSGLDVRPLRCDTATSRTGGPRASTTATCDRRTHRAHGGDPLHARAQEIVRPGARGDRLIRSGRTRAGTPLYASDHFEATEPKVIGSNPLGLTPEARRACPRSASSPRGTGSVPSSLGPRPARRARRATAPAAGARRSPGREPPR